MIDPVSTLAGIAGWFLGGLVASYTALSILQLLWYLDRRKTRRYHEERERIIAYAEMSEHLHEAMDSAAKIIEDHVDYMDPTDYFTPEIREILAQRAMGYADDDPTPSSPGRPNRDTAATYEEAKSERIQ